MFIGGLGVSYSYAAEDRVRQSPPRCKRSNYTFRLNSKKTMEKSEEKQLLNTNNLVLDIVEKRKRDSQTNGKHFCRRHSFKRISNQRRKAERVVSKSGQFNIQQHKSFFKFRVFPDIVTVFVEARWRWTLCYCIFTYIFSWLIFGVVWFIILYVHGDMEVEHLPHIRNSTEWIPCVTEINSFTSIFLFSIEIHTTIGYGTRTITLQCPSAMFTMCIESIIGTITQSFLVGIVFAKLTRPKNRAYTLVFSKNAVINQRDRHLCLTFRVGNTRKSRIISASVHAYLIRCVTVNKEIGELIELKLSVDSSKDVLFMFPVSAVHQIDNSSPLFSMSSRDLFKSELEILVIVEGTIESTGQPVQAKSSYTSHEILWGYQFMDMVEYKESKQGYVVDYLKFNETNHVKTPVCSAKKLQRLYTNKVN